MWGSRRSGGSSVWAAAAGSLPPTMPATDLWTTARRQSSGRSVPHGRCAPRLRWRRSAWTCHDARVPISDRLLMGPGPSNPYPEVMLALARPVMGHLDPQFLDLLDETNDRLRVAFATSNALTLPISGTGSAGMEAAFVDFVVPEIRWSLGSTVSLVNGCAKWPSAAGPTSPGSRLPGPNRSTPRQLLGAHALPPSWPWSTRRRRRE